MNETPSALTPLDPTLLYPLAVTPALPPIDADAAGLPDLPAGHPRWQRDAISISTRARAVIATIVPIVVRTLTYWDHRIRDLSLGPRTLTIDPAGCYRLR
jgi:hypothetical protein